MIEKYLYDGSKKFNIKKSDTADTSLCPDKTSALALQAANGVAMDELHSKLYADKKEGVIFLFQAMDAAGKDGTIRSVLQCLSPHGIYEVAFKAPSSDEQAHDYLWRIAKKVPAKGEIAIFNRSHYEELLIWRVKKLYEVQSNAKRIDKSTMLEKRFEDIRNWESYLYNNNVRVVKIFLNVSKEEQARRFLSRMEEPEKHWKFSANDFEERKYWDAYQEAFEDIINKTSTKESPWYVVPADHKWYMRYIVSEIVLNTLKDMNPQFPVVTHERLAQFDSYINTLYEEYPSFKEEKEGKKEKKKSKEKAEKKEKKSKKEKK